MGCSPVGDDHTIEVPVTFQYLIDEHLVVRSVLVEILVVGTHDAPHLAFLDGSLERRQVDLVKGSIGHLDIDMAAELLLIVEDIMLYTGSYAVSLNTIDVGHHHLRSEARIFAHIFEVATIERRAIDVNTRAEQDILAAIARLLSYIEAV